MPFIFKDFCCLPPTNCYEILRFKGPSSIGNAIKWFFHVFCCYLLASGISYWVLFLKTGFTYGKSWAMIYYASYIQCNMDSLLLEGIVVIQCWIFSIRFWHEELNANANFLFLIFWNQNMCDPCIITNWISKRKF